MTWDLEKSETGTRLVVTYGIGGYMAGGFRKIAPIVDEVVGEQAGKAQELSGNRQPPPCREVNAHSAEPCSRASSTSRTFRARAYGVNGFCRKSRLGSSERRADDVVVGVAGHEEHARVRAQRPRALGASSRAAHARHHDVGEQR